MGLCDHMIVRSLMSLMGKPCGETVGQLDVILSDHVVGHGS